MGEFNLRRPGGQLGGTRAWRTTARETFATVSDGTVVGAVIGTVLGNPVLGTLAGALAGFAIGIATAD